MTVNTMFNLGFDYYPEHWGEEEWPQDLQRMRELGVQCVRIGEYAWCRIEPEEGRFEFDWLDRFFALAQEHGIKIILGTPTDGLPPWVWQNYPGTVLMQDDGRRNTTNRRMRCPNSPDLMRLGDSIITAIAERYGNHPQLIGWQTDNEITGAICYCEVCQNACREHMREKFETVGEFNRSMGLIFWSHEVTDWSQVILPRYNMENAHPSLRLEVHRFFSKSWAQFARRQVDLIHRLSPGRWVTHNLPGYAIPADVFDLAAAHDFISIDIYPKAMLDGRWDLAARNDACRSFQNGPHWVMELQSGTPCTKFYKAPIPREGQLRLWAHQSAAHGAAGVVFFRWRKSPAGQEMFGNGLLDHDSRPRRMYSEVKKLGEDFNRLREILPHYDVSRQVAIVMDFTDATNSNIHKFAIDIPFIDEPRKWWRAARELGLNVRYVRSTDDLSPYALVIAPTQYTTSPQIVGNFTEYVRNGGMLIGGNRMGFFDIHGKPSRLTLPGGMIDLFGVEVEEYERVMEPNPNAANFGGNLHLPCREWNYILTEFSARPLATYERDYYAGRTCVSENRLESGRSLYVGTYFDQAGTREFLRLVLKDSILPVLGPDWPEDVETMTLEDGSGKPLCVLMNHALDPRSVTLQHEAQDLLDGAKGSQWEFLPLGFRWLHF